MLERFKPATALSKQMPATREQNDGGQSMKSVRQSVAVCAAALLCAAMIAPASFTAFAQGGSGQPASSYGYDLHDREHDTSQANAAPARIIVSTTTPVPAPEASPVAESIAAPRAIAGVACIDVNRNGLCNAGELPVKDVIVRAPSGAFVLTNALGQFALSAPVTDVLEVSLPSGYLSLAGLGAMSVPLAGVTTNEPVALALQPAAAFAPAPAPVITTPLQIQLPAELTQPIVNVRVDLQPIYLALAGIAVVLLLSQLMVTGVLRSMRRAYDRSFKRQEVMLSEQRVNDLSMRMHTQNGWHRLAEQLVADALSAPASIDEQAGILDASSLPAPKFTLASSDGSAYTFTTHPNLMKQQRLIGRGDKVMKLSRVSPTSVMDAALLWEFVMTSRRLWRVTPPRNAEWYLVVRPGRATATLGLPLPQVRQLSARR